MNFAQLRAFHAVAGEGGFTTAARRLGLTQPAVTLQVRALEQAYGVNLFHRRGRRVELTDTGRQVFVLTRRLFTLADEAEDLLAAAAGLQRGRLNVGADGPYHVIRLLAAFRQSHPGVELSVAFGNSEDVRAGLLDYRTDAAVLAELDDDGRFFSVPIGRYPVVVLVPSSHAWAGRRSLRLKELHRQPMIRREQGSATRKAFEAALAQHGVGPDFILEIGSREAVHEAVANGMAISVVMAPEIGHDDRLRPIRIADAEISIWESAVCLAERRETRVVAAFLAIAEALAAQPAKRGAA